MGERIKLGDVRKAFRLVGEVRELGSDPRKWRPHMVLALRGLVNADVVVSSEIHFRKLKSTGRMKVFDIGWGSEPDGKVWQINTEREDEQPENFWLAMAAPVDRRAGAGAAQAGVVQPNAVQAGAAQSGAAQASAGATDSDFRGPPPDGDADTELVPVRPTQKVHGGRYLILSQYALPHAGVVDQLGLHRAWDDTPFTPAHHKLVRLFHVELGRLWKRDAIRCAKDPTTALPPRLSQTLNELLAGSSEKQIALKLDLSRHTIHNYVKALHQRFGVSSRGELLARCGREQSTFTPRLSMEPPKER